MVDFFALLLFFAVIYKAEYVSASINQDYISGDSCKALKGLFAIMIIFVHISMKTSSGVVFHGFAYVGYLAVSVFLFISGYGLMKSLSANEKYLDTFPKKKLFAIVIPYIIVILIYWAYSFVGDSPYSVKEVLASLINGVPVADNSWYIIACIFCYLAFYVMSKAFGDKRKAIALGILVFCLAWIGATYMLGYPQWWYLSTPAFAAGAFWMIYEEKILNLFREHYFAKAIPFAVLLLASIYTTYRFEAAVFKIVCSSLFAVTVFVLCMKIRINSPILKFLGRYSLEIYLIHGLFIRLFRSDAVYIGNDFGYVMSVVAAAIIAAIPLNYLFKRIKKCAA